MQNILNKTIFDNKRIDEILIKIGPDVIKIFEEQKYELGGMLPEELSFGIVAGYLRGKGYSWEEAFIGMDKFIRTVRQAGAQTGEFKGEMSIRGNHNGAVDIKLKENKNI